MMALARQTQQPRKISRMPIAPLTFPWIEGKRVLLGDLFVFERAIGLFFPSLTKKQIPKPLTAFFIAIN
jgi:hypothetical protein